MTKATSLTTYLTKKYNFLSYDSTLELVTEQLLGNPTEGDAEIQACIDMGVYLPNLDTWLFPEDNHFHLFLYQENEWIGDFNLMKEVIEKGGTYLSGVNGKDEVQDLEGGLGACWVDSFEELLQRNSTANL